MLLDLMTSVPRRGTWLVLLATASVGACDVSRVGPSREELRSLIDTHCERVQACRCETPITAESCDEEITDRWNRRVRLGDARGLQYDAECFSTIVADLERDACYTPGGSNPLCASFCAVYHGDKQLEESCEAVDELVSDCAQGLLCHEGTCVEPCTVLGGRQQGEPCVDPELGTGFFDDCAQGLACSWETGTCIPLATEGQSCADTQCSEDLYCNWQSGTCVRGLAEGEICDDAECAADLYCAWTEPGQLRCQAYATEGQSCYDARCEDDLFCNQANVCVSAPVAGEPCLGGNFCGEDLQCDFDANRCVELPLAGEPCLNGSRCADGLRCDFDSSRCVELPLAGEPCLQGECATEAWCQTTMEDPDGTCVPPVAVGEMCSGHRQCESGFCPNGFCWALPLEGEDCEGAEVCAPGLVCNGRTCEPTLTRAPAACTYAGW